MHDNLINDNSSPVKSTKQRTKHSEQHLRRETFLLECFTKRTDAFAYKFESYEHQTAMETAPCSPTRLTSSLARLLTRCACFVMVRCSCYHMPVGSDNIVTEHVVGTLISVPLCVLHWILCLSLQGAHQFLVQNSGHDSDSWTESRVKLCHCHSPQ